MLEFSSKWPVKVSEDVYEEPEEEEDLEDFEEPEEESEW